jgi:hypothetical protein
MKEDYKNPAFKKLLQKLQEESWQLELIISGFAIFGLFSAFGELKIALNTAQSEEQVYASIFFTVALVSCIILIFNLLLHVILRGLWIGALGLRYVSGDIDYEALNYSPKFTKYLNKKIGSFDKYIATLENYCSIIFAISFLLIFYVMALTLCIVTVAIIGNYVISNESFNETWRQAIGIPLLLFILLGMLLTFIDFITLGWLKKNKLISKFYFPIYWLFSFLTLSFLYRPLLYNFLDNKFGRRISLLLFPVFLTLMYVTSIADQKSNYFNEGLEFNSSFYFANPKNYEDQLTEADDLAETVSIQSKVITDPYIEVFINFENAIEDAIFEFEPSLKPENDHRGLKSQIYFNDVNMALLSDQRQLYLKTFNNMYSIQLDSLKMKTEFIVSYNSKKRLGFETFIATDSLSQGKHMIHVMKKNIRAGDTAVDYLRSIPFWYFGK